MSNQHDIVNQGTYYVECGTSFGTDVTYTLNVETEKLISLPKGKIRALKSNKSGQMTVPCLKVPNAIGYRIQYSLDEQFKSGKRTIKTANTSKTIKGLKKGVRYYVRVAPYTTYGDGTYVYGQNSLPKAVRIKK